MLDIAVFEAHLSNVTPEQRGKARRLTRAASGCTHARVDISLDGRQREEIPRHMFDERTPRRVFISFARANEAEHHDCLAARAHVCCALDHSQVAGRQPRGASTHARRSSRSRDRTLSPAHPSLSNLSQPESPSNLLLRRHHSPLHSEQHGFARRYSRIVLLSIISIIKLLIEYVSLLFNQFKAYPIKTSLILLIFVAILVIHSFYLINLAYRIETRLQSLHDAWPLPSTKGAFSSPDEL